MLFKKKNKNKDIEETKENNSEATQITNESTSTVDHKKISKDRKIILFKAITGALAVCSVAMLCYAIFQLFYDSSNSNYSSESYITLDGKSIQESKTIYSQFGSKKKKCAADYALLGSKLFISETKIYPSLLKSENKNSIFGEGNTNFYLYDLTTDTSKFTKGQSNSENNSYYIELTNISEGDYLIYSDSVNSKNKSDINPYSLSTDEAINYVSYSLPDDKGIRKRITIRNNSSSPYLLINIKNCGSSLPNDYYDAVVFYSQYEQKENTDEYNSSSEKTEDDKKAVSNLLNESFSTSNYKIKFVDNIQEAYNAKANKSFALYNGNEIITSTYLIGNNNSLKTNVLSSNSSLSGYDSNPEIRELTGYLGKAGERNLGVYGNDITTSNSLHLGKECYLINESISKISSDIQTLLKN